jgi:hypothetical protein
MTAQSLHELVSPRPCPFCGNPAPELAEYRSGWFVECVCQTDKGPEATREEALWAWNHRIGD